MQLKHVHRYYILSKRKLSLYAFENMEDVTAKLTCPSGTSRPQAVATNSPLQGTWMPVWEAAAAEAIGRVSETRTSSPSHETHNLTSSGTYPEEDVNALDRLQRLSDNTELYVVVPFRNRAQHLHIWLKEVMTYFQVIFKGTTNFDFCVVVAHQCDSKPFNKGIKYVWLILRFSAAPLGDVLGLLFVP